MNNTFSNRRLVFWGLGLALSTVLICCLAVWLGSQLQDWEAPGDGYFDEVSLMLVFVASALASAILVLGYPLYLMVRHRPREGFLLLLSTIGWLTLIMLGIIAVIVFL